MTFLFVVNHTKTRKQCPPLVPTRILIKSHKRHTFEIIIDAKKD